MYHNKAHRKLGRKRAHRMATLRALSTALFDRERIRTTLMKAKELRPFAEKLITKSKRDDLHSRRLVMRHIHDQRVARKLFDNLSPRYTDRNGGYLRILKLGRRLGDGAEMALVELIGSEPTFAKKEEPKKGLVSRLRKDKAGKSGEEATAEKSSGRSAKAKPDKPAKVRAKTRSKTASRGRAKTTRTETEKKTSKTSRRKKKS
jgi:large subunit ribosomal protein L17